MISMEELDAKRGREREEYRKEMNAAGAVNNAIYEKTKEKQKEGWRLLKELELMIEKTRRCIEETGKVINRSFEKR